MSEHDIDFDWSPLGEKFWRSAAEACSHKPTEQQLRFACCRHSHGLNASDSAAKAGYEGDADAIRVAGHRASKSTAVMELLSYAVAETGKGDEGLVSGKEARRILSRIARRGNNNEKIKSLEALARLDQSEREAKQTGEPDYAAELYLLARSIPRDAVGAMIGLAHYFGAAGHIIGHPFLKEVAPIAAKRFTADWQHYRSKHDPEEIALLDKLAAGPLLDGDELVAVIAAKQPRVATIQVGDADAA